MQRDVRRPVRAPSLVKRAYKYPPFHASPLTPRPCSQRSHASSRLPPVGRFVGTTYDYDFFRTAAELPKERIGR